MALLRTVLLAALLILSGGPLAALMGSGLHTCRCAELAETDAAGSCCQTETPSCCKSGSVPSERSAGPSIDAGCPCGHHASALAHTGPQRFLGSRLAPSWSQPTASGWAEPEPSLRPRARTVDVEVPPPRDTRGV